MTLSLFTTPWITLLEALVILLIANGAPIIANVFLGKHWVKPIDCGMHLKDGQRLLGDTKTWRGLVAAMSITAFGAVMLGYSAWLGVVSGLLSMIGDLLSSFIKRRRKLTESSHARGIDTVPETLLPLCFLQQPLYLGFADIACIIVAFYLIEEYISPILYRLHIRKRPY